MELEYYKQYYELERYHWWFKARERIIMQHIQALIKEKTLPAQLKILNVGCGTGRSSEYLSQYGKVTSVEYDKFCCEFTTQKTGLEIINGDITQLPFANNEFDLVCAFDVIEHVEDDKKAMEEMKRVCKPDGVVFITVPAFQSFWGQHDVINHHFRRYRLSEIKTLFNQVNQKGKIIFGSYFNFYLFIPIGIVRQISNLINKLMPPQQAKSDFESIPTGFANAALEKLMYSENVFLSQKIALPFGVSILCYWQKTS